MDPHAGNDRKRMPKKDALWRATATAAVRGCVVAALVLACHYPAVWHKSHDSAPHGNIHSDRPRNGDEAPKKFAPRHATTRAHANKNQRARNCRCAVHIMERVGERMHQWFALGNLVSAMRLVTISERLPALAASARRRAGT